MTIDTSKIKDLDISEIIGRYIELRPNGPEFQACCPFHDEKTPSFTVVPNKSMYHCFGCGAHGDAIDFVMEYTGCSFKEAVKSIDGRIETDAPVKKQTKRFDPYEKYKPSGKPKSLPIVGQKLKIINPKRDGKIWEVEPVAVYPYLQGCVIRVMVKGKKVTPMIRWCEGPQGEGWHTYPFSEPRELYGLSELMVEGRQVVVVEGEKARDAVQAAGDNKLAVISWAGGTNGLDKTDWSPLKGRKVILWPDNDETGRKAMSNVAKILFDVGAESVRMIHPPEDLPKGWDGADREWETANQLFGWCKSHVHDIEPESVVVDQVPMLEPPELESPPLAEPPPYIFEQQAFEPVEETHDVPEKLSDDWKAMLMFKDDGDALQNNVNNAQTLLGYHQDMAGVLAYNEFTKEIDVAKRPPWHTERGDFPRKLTDVDDTRATAWLERKGVKLAINVVHNAIVSAAHHKPYNPLHDYLNGLEWDGKARIDKALHFLLGCSDNQYTGSVSRRFLVGAAARALNPGCKMDTMLILEGPQGLKKSTAVAELFGEEWFTDELGDLGSKDAALQVQGVWCVEIAELATMNRAESNRIKEWITRRVDRFRPPYGRNIVDAPRQCVLVGTVNPEGGYLKDATGGRRFWPVRCSKINVDWIRARRDQIWAEAVAAYRSGERWWFDKGEIESAQKEQEARYESDPWTDQVVGFITGKEGSHVTVSEVMDHLTLSNRDQNQASQNRVAKILVAEGWRRVQKTFNKKRVWCYIKEEVKVGTSA